MHFVNSICKLRHIQPEIASCLGGAEINLHGDLFVAKDKLEVIFQSLNTKEWIVKATYVSVTQIKCIVPKMMTLSFDYNIATVEVSIAQNNEQSNPRIFRVHSPLYIAKITPSFSPSTEKVPICATLNLSKVSKNPDSYRNLAPDMNAGTQESGLHQFPLWIRLSWTLGARNKLIYKTLRADWATVDRQGYFRVQVHPPRLNAGQIQVSVSLGKTCFYGMIDCHACFPTSCRMPYRFPR